MEFNLPIAFQLIFFDVLTSDVQKLSITVAPGNYTTFPTMSLYLELYD